VGDTQQEVQRSPKQRPPVSSGTSSDGRHQQKLAQDKELKRFREELGKIRGQEIPKDFDLETLTDKEIKLLREEKIDLELLTKDLKRKGPAPRAAAWRGVRARGRRPERTRKTHAMGRVRQAFWHSGQRQTHIQLTAPTDRSTLKRPQPPAREPSPDGILQEAPVATATGSAAARRR